MIEILEHLQQYVPGARTELEEIQEREETNPKMQAIPVGGDQLTCERIRGAHMARLDGDTQEERLEGLITMVEDFHEKINFLQAMMDRFYKPGSARETGTLYQLRNVINRRNVTKNVSADYHAVGSFIDLVTSAHVIAAALKAFGMDSIEDPCPKVPLFTESADEGSKKRLLDKIVGEIVDTFFLNSLTVTVNRIEDDETAIEGPIVDDGVYNYATNVTKYGLLRKISVLATRNGDGIRQIRHWKYGLLVYDLSHKIKYRLESFLLLAGVNALFTEKQRHQIIWNRFVNLSGGKDKNLDGDYVMELLNKYAKGRVKLLGPNQTPEIVDRIGKTMMFCHNVNEKLEREIGVHPAGIHHAQRDKTQDIKAVVNQLKNANVFSVIRGRQHDSFQEQFDMFQNVNSHALHKWLNVKKQEYSNGKYAF
ncbi:uncharacterized protein LOC117326153 isoform X3 [Pecten maximus]|uniref:uncharacterized protein LOC117326153 isoform X3 n=1 Tax=Pecten maximus TaxID=6579 RepID=UPI0014586022|nr:uncharacterized protein LOC117326153 isoform X3 [Pecten maximus]